MVRGERGECHWWVGRRVGEGKDEIELWDRLEIGGIVGVVMGEKRGVVGMVVGIGTVEGIVVDVVVVVVIGMVEVEEGRVVELVVGIIGLFGRREGVMRRLCRVMGRFFGWVIFEVDMVVEGIVVVRRGEEEVDEMNSGIYVRMMDGACLSRVVVEGRG